MRTQSSAFFSAIGSFNVSRLDIFSTENRRFWIFFLSFFCLENLFRDLFLLKHVLKEIPKEIPKEVPKEILKHVWNRYRNRFQGNKILDRIINTFIEDLNGEKRSNSLLFQSLSIDSDRLILLTRCWGSYLPKEVRKEILKQIPKEVPKQILKQTSKLERDPDMSVAR